MGKARKKPSLDSAMLALSGELERMATCIAIINARRKLQSEFREKWSGTKVGNIASFHYESVWETLVLTYSRIWDGGKDALSFQRFHNELKNSEHISEFFGGGDLVLREEARIRAVANFRKTLGDPKHGALLKLRDNFLAHRLLVEPDNSADRHLPNKGDVLRLSGDCFQLFSDMTLATLSTTHHFEDFQIQSNSLALEYFEHLT